MFLPLSLRSFSMTMRMAAGMQKRVLTEYSDSKTMNKKSIFGKWEPTGMTSEIRLNSLSDARQALLSLLVTGGFKLKEQGISPWAALEKWWTDVPEFGFQIHVKEGSAIFNADGLMKSVVFNFTFP